MSRVCECGTEMFARPNNGNVWECQNRDCDCVEPVVKCVKCNRVIHDDDGNVCICCSDLMGHGETADGKPLDWDKVPCCPSCGSFDVRLRALVKMEGWTKLDLKTGKQKETDPQEYLDGTEAVYDDSDMGGHCDSCDADWDDGQGCLGGDWGRCRATYQATIIASQPFYTHLETKARGPEDAAAMFKEMVKAIENDELIPQWAEDDGDPHSPELIEITDNDTNEVVWSRPPDPHVQDGYVFQIATEWGHIYAKGEGDSVWLKTVRPNDTDGVDMKMTHLSREMLLAIDSVRTKS